VVQNRAFNGARSRSYVADTFTERTDSYGDGFTVVSIDVQYLRRLSALAALGRWCVTGMLFQFSPETSKCNIVRGLDC
jgi:hypothetical protein